uniref:Interleukin-12 subunit beta n=1 Tax=Knipowitschia caucasica TaxID=637954 RepID=A0AAV2J9Q0_KNICA
MDNVVVLRVPDIYGSRVTVPISCGEAFRDEPVTWKRDGVFQPALQGNDIHVTVREWDGGDFSCHQSPEGPALNHTLLLVQLEPDNRTAILQPRGADRDYIHCSTPNYRGSFHCHWSKHHHRSGASVLMVKSHRNQEPVPCVVEPSGSEMCCEENNCPYKEEQHRISLTLYMKSASRLEAYTKAFYLRDIVTPGPPTNLHIITRSETSRAFGWNYPESWDKPCSYFSLLFQVKVVRSGGTCHSEEYVLEDATSQMVYVVNRAKKYVFCVRAQDKHTGGPWSEWSQCDVTRDRFIC